MVTTTIVLSSAALYVRRKLRTPKRFWENFRKFRALINENNSMKAEIAAKDLEIDKLRIEISGLLRLAQRMDLEREKYRKMAARVVIAHIAENQKPEVENLEGTA